MALVLLLAGDVWGRPFLGPSRSFGSGAPAALVAGDQDQVRVGRLWSGALLVVYRDDAANPFFPDVRYALVDPALPDPLVLDAPLSTASSWDSEPDVVCDSLGCVAAWTSTFGSQQDTLWLQRFDTQGGLVGGPLAAPAGVSELGAVALALSADGALLAVAWNEGSTLATRLFNRSGAVVGSAGSLPLAELPRVAAVGAAFQLVVSRSGGAADELLLVDLSRQGVLGPPQQLGTNASGRIVPQIVATPAETMVVALFLSGTSFGTVHAWRVGNPSPARELVHGAAGCFGRPEVVSTSEGWVVLHAEQTVPPLFDQLRGALRTDAGFVETGRLSPRTRVNAGSSGSIGGLVLDGGVGWLVASDSSSEASPELVLGAVSLNPLRQTPETGAPVLRGAVPQTAPEVVPFDGGFALSWLELRGVRDSRIVGTIVDAQGTGRTITDLTEPLFFPDGFAAGPSRDGLVVALRQSWGQGNQVDLLRFDGQRVTARQTAFDGVFAYPSWPAVVATPVNTWVLVGASSAGHRLYGFEASFDGGWVGTGPRDLAGWPARAERVAAAANGSSMFVGWEEESGSLRGARFSFSGTPLDPLDGGLLTNRRATGTRLASDGRDFLLVFTDRDVANEAIVAVVISGQTGRPASPEQLLMTSSQDILGTETFADVTWDGEQYLVTGSIVRRDGGGGDVDLIRVDADGGLSGRVTVAGTPEHELEGRVTSDGRGRSLLTWSAWSPSRHAREVRIRSAADVGFGGFCGLDLECRSGVCRASQCCLADGGCPAPTGGGAAGGGSAGGTAGGTVGGGSAGGSIGGGSAGGGSVGGGAVGGGAVGGGPAGGDAGGVGGGDSGGSAGGGAGGGAAAGGSAGGTSGPGFYVVGCSSAPELALGWALLLLGRRRRSGR